MRPVRSAISTPPRGLRQPPEIFVGGITDVRRDLKSRFPASENTSQKAANRAARRSNQINDLRQKFPTLANREIIGRTGNSALPKSGKIPGLTS